MITIHPDHPYYKFRNISVFELRHGGWRVEWRSFDTILQDMDYATEAEAQNLAGMIRAGLEVTHMDEDQGPVDFMAADAFWRSL